MNNWIYDRITNIDIKIFIFRLSNSFNQTFRGFFIKFNEKEI